MSKTLIKDSVPAFLAKLWKLLNDTETDNIIHWSKDGTTFVVKDQGKFSADILPKYFKHGNFASFVRQLNMYGFHKVFNAERGGLNGRDYWEFSNNNFQRDYPDKLDMVKRKVSQSTLKLEQNKIKPDDITIALSEISAVKNEQENINSKFAQMKMENELLWNEIITLRKKHQMQQQIVNKLVQFLASCMYKRKGLPVHRKRLMLENAPASTKTRRVDFEGNYEGDNSSSGYYVNYPSGSESRGQPEDKISLEDLKNGAIVVYPQEVAAGITSSETVPPAYSNMHTVADNQLSYPVVENANTPEALSFIDSDFDLDTALANTNTSIGPSTENSYIPHVIPLDLESPTTNPDTVYIGEKVDNVQESLDQLHSLLSNKTVDINNVFHPRNPLDDTILTNEQDKDLEELLRSFTKDAEDDVVADGN